MSITRLGQYTVDAKRMWLVITVSCGLAALTVLAVLLVSSLGGAQHRQPRAAIVDQLAITDPNPDFVASATRQLEDAGYAVDYVPSGAVTVDLYRDLPERGYALLLLRSHSSQERTRAVPAFIPGPTPVSGSVLLSESIVGLFTNEPYSKSEHVSEQRLQRLAIVSYPDRAITERYFGLVPAFIASSTAGRFKDTIVILMGCGGLNSDSMAQAFVAKGAKSFISWNGLVTPQHTDASTEELLRHLVGEGMDPKEAVARTMSAVGPDPAFDSSLLAYP